MNRQILVFVFLFLLISGIKAEINPVSFSEKTKVSVLTCAPGQELYSVFGHSAIRVSDPVNQIDLAFNYGTFDFNTPFFYLKFGHGSLDYLLSVSSFKGFMREYFMEGRSVWEQELTISLDQKQKLFEALILNAQPQNRAYEYDFFYDNCATRVAYIIIDHLPGKMEFTSDLPVGDLSFREAIHPYLEAKPWTKLGIDLILGSPADARTDSLTVMFLPDYLMNQFSGIHYSSNGRGRKLTKETELILDFTDKNLITSRQTTPMVILWGLAILILFLSMGEHLGYIRPLRWLDIPLFLAGGIAGLIVFYLAIISNHEVTGSNWNLLWVNPLLFLFITNVKSTFVNIIKKIQLLFLLIFLVSLAFMQQNIPGEFIPLVFVFIFRLGKPFHLLIKPR